MNKYQVELTAIIEARNADEAIAKLLDDPKKHAVKIIEQSVTEKNFTSEIVLNHEYTVNE